MCPVWSVGCQPVEFLGMDRRGILETGAGESAVKETRQTHPNGPRMVTVSVSVSDEPVRTSARSAAPVVAGANACCPMHGDRLGQVAHADRLGCRRVPALST